MDICIFQNCNFNYAIFSNKFIKALYFESYSKNILACV